MNAKLKTFFSGIVAVSCAMILSFGCSLPGGEDPFAGKTFEKVKLYDTSKIVVDQGSKTINDFTAKSVVANMKFGWNLGNTFDAIAGDEKTGRKDQPHNAGLNSETCWGQPKTTQAMIKLLKSSGVSTIRIPTSWSNHIIDDNYTIDPQWMNRVKEVVDWSIAEGLYVILNDHHDNVAPGTLSYARGYCPNEADMDESQRFLYNVWSQIATAFNGSYDEHLIFETINEPRLAGDEHEWGWDANCDKCKKAMYLVNKYNQLCLDAIRETGGNNSKRIVMFPSYVASPDAAMTGFDKGIFTIPTDTATNKLALSVHMYTPYPFAMQYPGEKTFTDSHKGTLDYYFNSLSSKFSIPVVIGEMGATNKDNNDARKEWFDYYLKGVKSKGFAAVLWDNGNEKNAENGSELYGYMNRNTNPVAWYSSATELISTAVSARN